MGVIEAHETRCHYATLEELVKRIEPEGESAVQKILDLLRFDHQIRPFMSEKLGLHPEDMNLYFGRPLIETINMFGLKVRSESDGSFTLSILK